MSIQQNQIKEVNFDKNGIFGFWIPRYDNSSKINIDIWVDEISSTNTY